MNCSNRFRHSSGQWRLEVRASVSVKCFHEEVRYEVNNVRVYVRLNLTVGIVSEIFRDCHDRLVRLVYLKC